MSTIGSAVFGTKGTVTSSRTVLVNLDDTTRTVSATGTFVIGGKLVTIGLPTSDPGISGAVWNDSGTLKISP